MAKRIIVDAGHGGYDNGASFEGRLEKDDNLRLALQVGKDLADMGYDVLYTRDDDIYQSPSTKAAIANDAGADFFVSIHRNSSATPNQYNGVQTLVFEDSGVKGQMARNVNEELSDVGFQNLGVSVRPNLTVLRHTKMPAILVEAGFINSEKDNAIFDNQFPEVAKAIAEGIDETLTEDTSYYPPPAYRVQIGLYRNFANASFQLAKAERDGFTGYIVPSGPYYAVQIGNFEELDEAAQEARKLRSMGYETLVVSGY